MRRETNLSELTPFQYGKGTPTRKTNVDRLLEKTAWETARLRTLFEISGEEDRGMLVRPGPKAFAPSELAKYFREVAGLDWVIIYPFPNISRGNHLADNKNDG